MGDHLSCFSLAGAVATRHLLCLLCLLQTEAPKAKPSKPVSHDLRGAHHC